MPIGDGVVLNQGLGKYATDVVFCIDATGSMLDAIQTVKDMASGFSAKVREALKESKREVEELRVKVITFRDFGTDTDALVSSPFFSLPDENVQFQQFVDDIQAIGGGDEPENGLEALAEAMNSEWTQDGKKRRHIIVLFTDASAIALEDSDKSHPQYPANMPPTLAALQDWWETGTPSGYLEKSAARLIIFAPNAEPWNTIKGWNQTEYGDPVEPGKGCPEATLDAILALICKSFAPVSNQ